MCIRDRSRAHTSEIVERLSEMVLQFPASFTNRLEMLRHIEADEKEKSVLRMLGERQVVEIQQKNEQISSIREEAQAMQKQKENEIDQLKVVYSSEVEQLQLQVRDLSSQNQHLIVTNEAEVTELKAKAVVCEAQVKNIDKTLRQEKEQFGTWLAKERGVSRRLRIENHDLQCNINSLQHTNSTLEADISRKDAAIKRNESELEANTRLLREKDSVISGMSEQLTRARECLATRQQVSMNMKETDNYGNYNSHFSLVIVLQELTHQTISNC